MALEQISMPSTSTRDVADIALRDLVVIGASAGGVSALRTIASRLPARFPAAVLVVLHTGPHPSRLPHLLGAVGPNEARLAVDGDLLQPGCIVAAVPDHHLIVRDGAIVLTRGAREHHTRPAIDPLFRSAALGGGPPATVWPPGGGTERG